MAANFKTIVCREGDILHIKPEGDFDGSSALELINTLVENCGSAQCVVINTSGLQEVYPFGKAVFERHFSLARKLNPSTTFTGKYAQEIAPCYYNGDS